MIHKPFVHSKQQERQTPIHTHIVSSCFFLECFFFLKDDLERVFFFPEFFFSEARVISEFFFFFWSVFFLKRVIFLKTVFSFWSVFFFSLTIWRVFSGFFLERG